MFLNLVMFPLLRSCLGMGGVYLVHAAATLAGVVFAYFLMPETRNKSLTQLEMIFHCSAAGEKGGKEEPI